MYFLMRHINNALIMINDKNKKQISDGAYNVIFMGTARRRHAKYQYMQISA